MVDVTTFPDIDDMVRKIRECDLCKINPDGKMPFIFKGEKPFILVISEGSPSEVWKGDIGRQNWAEGDLYTKKGGIPGELCDWLGLERSDFEEWVFWIQRRNCWSQEAVDAVMKRCSENYINEAIRLIDPEIIILLGGHASDFFGFHGSVKSRIALRRSNPKLPVIGKSREVFVLYHPSWRTKKYRKGSENYQAASEIGKLIMDIARSKVH